MIEKQDREFCHFKGKRKPSSRTLVSKVLCFRCSIITKTIDLFATSAFSSAYLLIYQWTRNLSHSADFGRGKLFYLWQVHRHIPCLTDFMHMKTVLASKVGMLASMPSLPNKPPTESAALFKALTPWLMTSGVHSVVGRLESIGSAHLGSVTDVHEWHLMASPETQYN